MYTAPIKATIQDYSSCPVDEKHERQQRMQIKLTGALSPEMFDDIDAEVQQDARRCNEGRKDSVAYPMRRRVSMVVSAEDDSTHEFPEAELTGMAFKRPAKNQSLGTWAMTVAFDWDDKDLLYIAHAHRMSAKVSLEKLADKPGAQTTIDDAIGKGNGEG